MVAGHLPRRRFGQNFLVDPNVIARIVAALDMRRDDAVVEIGPGLGALTAPLAARLERLHVVEIDRDLAGRLRQRFAPAHVCVHEADALAFDFATLGEGLRMIGNLPYNISTPLLFHLARYAERVRDITVMLQREVVQRMVAAAGSADYGRLSVMLQYRFTLDKLMDVAPGAFRPVPQVRSAVVRLVPRPASALTAFDEPLLGRIVAAAFGQRRKTLRNSLEKFLEDADFVALGIDAGLRGERLTIAQYVQIANHCAARGSLPPQAV